MNVSRQPHGGSYLSSVSAASLIKETPLLSGGVLFVSRSDRDVNVKRDV